MEDAVEQLENLARSVGECTRCDELVASRLRAVPGGGHPHCTVMVVSLASDPTDEEDGGLAGESLLADLAEFMPALAESRDKVYVTALAKCVPRSDGAVRGPSPQELEDCYPYLSKELTITTPHYVLTVGEETTRFLLGKLFKTRPTSRATRSSCGCSTTRRSRSCPWRRRTSCASASPRCARSTWNACASSRR